MSDLSKQETEPSATEGWRLGERIDVESGMVLSEDEVPGAEVLWRAFKSPSYVCLSILSSRAPSFTLFLTLRRSVELSPNRRGTSTSWVYLAFCAFVKVLARTALVIYIAVTP